MRALSLDCGVRVDPFDEPARSLWIAGMTLGDWQAAAVRDAGIAAPLERLIELPESLEGPALLLYEPVFVSAPFLVEFLRRAQDGDDRRPGVAAIPRGPLTDHFQPVSDMLTEPLDMAGKSRVLPDLFWLPAGWTCPDDVHDGAALRRHLRQEAQRIEVPVDQSRVRRHRLPAIGPPPHEALLPDGDLVVAHIEHWFHLHRLASVLPRLVARARLSERRVEKGASIIGRNCEIHPTAIVESSVLGDGVTLGPFSSVRHSWVGRGAQLGEHSRVKDCIIGEDCHVLGRSYLLQCLCYPDSTLGNFLTSRSVYGRGIFLATGVQVMDVSFKGPVSVLRDGRRFPTGTSFLGHAVGHKCVLGARAVFEPGLSIGNRRVVVMPPGDGVGKIDPALAAGGVPSVWDRGALVPLERVAPPGYEPPELS